MRTGRMRWLTPLVFIGFATPALASEFFLPPIALPASPYQPTSVSTGDANGDGRPDLFLVAYPTSGQPVALLYLNGPSGFSPHRDLALGFWPSTVLSADVDGDDDEDLVVGNGYIDFTDVGVAEGRGDGTYDPLTTTSSEAGGAHRLTSGDYDGDGALDLAVLGKPSGSNLSVLDGSGSGSFTRGYFYGACASCWGIETLDYDGDSVLDLAVVDGLYIKLMHGMGDGTFELEHTLSTLGSASSGITTGDLDSDGLPELVVSSSGQGVSVFRNQGGASFDRVDYPLASQLATTLHLLDFDGDGHRDLVVPARAPAELLLYRGDGTGAFSPESSIPLPAGPDRWDALRTAAADLDQDGRVDLVTAHLSQTDLLIFMGTGGTTSTPTGPLPAQLALGLPAPHPVTGASTIRLALPRASGVTVEVLDVQGRRVRRVHEGRMDAGAQDLRLDARREGITAGVYFVRVTAGAETRTRRIVVLP